MPDIVLNRGLGTWVEKINNGADIILVPLSGVETDAVLKDRTPIDLASILGQAGNTEQTGTNWSRWVILNASVTLTIDDGADTARITVPEQTHSPGPPASNDAVALLACEDGASDAVRIVLNKHDFTVTSDGNDITTSGLATTGLVVVS